MEPGQYQMVCATASIKGVRARVGKFVVTLPRSIEIRQAVTVLAGALIGLVIALLLPFSGVGKFVMLIGAGGTIGWTFTSYSPLKGQTMGTWVRLQLISFLRSSRVDGESAIIAVGCSPISREPAGKVRILTGAVRVLPGTYDERGVEITERNRNIPAGMRQLGNTLVPQFSGTPLPAGSDLAPARPQTLASGNQPAPASPNSRAPRRRGAGASAPAAGGLTTSTQKKLQKG